jgi:hypothetical protein
MHLVYHDTKISYCILSFRDLVDWRPDYIITFIDDAYCMRQRIHNGGYKIFDLIELITWRTEEILIGDLLALLLMHKIHHPTLF